MINMSIINLELDDDVVDLLRQDDQPLDQAALELIVMDLHRRGMLSGGRAAELLGMDRLAFIRRADELGIPYFNYSREDWEAEIAASEKV
jgi:predicted HTH domain antitoxin